MPINSMTGNGFKNIARNPGSAPNVPSGGIKDQSQYFQNNKNSPLYARNMPPSTSSGSSPSFSGIAGNLGQSGIDLVHGIVGSGSGKGSSGGRGGISIGISGNGMSDYQAQLAALYGNQRSQAEALLAQQRAAAEEAYRKGMANLESSWNAKSGALSDNLQNTLASLARQYNASKGEVNADAEKSFREAYVNYMQNRKNINQNLSAQGISGGAAESTMAGMYNNYGNSRNDISTTLNDNLTSLENLYQDNRANAQSDYNMQYAQALSDYLNYQNQMEQNLANNIAGSYGNMVTALGNIDSGYTSALYDLMLKQADYAYKNAKATNPISNVSIQAINDMGTVTDYAKVLADQMRAQGADDTAIIRQLANQGVDLNTALALYGVA